MRRRARSLPFPGLACCTCIHNKHELTWIKLEA